MHELSTLNSTEIHIRAFIDATRGSAEDFARRFNWGFDVNNLLKLSERLKGKTHTTRDDIKRMAENRRAAVLTLVNNARNELGGASPRPPPRPKRTSPEQEAVNKKRQLTETLYNMRKNIQRLEAQLREQNEQALKLENEIKGMS